MKIFICIFAFIAVSSASGGGYIYATPEHIPLLYNSFASPLSSPIRQQYHSQDAYGQYSYGYSEPLSSKQEVRTSDGVTRGSYSYLDANGLIQTVDYTADANGFRVSATNLPRAPVVEVPKPVEETAEVALARAQHLAAHAEAKLRLTAAHSAAPKSNALASAPLNILPQQVEDTPEVAAAKKEFFIRYAQEQSRHELLHAKKSAAVSTSLKSQPLVNAVPLNSYLPSALPVAPASQGFRIVVPNLQRVYLPVKA